MSTPLLPSFRRQQLVLDFSHLKDSCPDGFYLSLTPGNPSLWAAVLFVHKGPYAGAVLRFQLSFPDSYPDAPPLITFSSDIFHPLVVPLTTYTFSASIVDASGTISASDEGRLPPGAFSLRYGFPNWFRRENRLADDKNRIEGVTEQDQMQWPEDSAADPGTSRGNTQVTHESRDRETILLQLLRHLQEAFENDAMLDEMPLNVAGDPSAWHAWRAHRGLAQRDAPPKSPTLGGDEGAPASPKRPEEWKWDGVWESRVSNGIEASINEATLFGSLSGGRAGRNSVDLAHLDSRQRMTAIADRQIRFAKLDNERFEEVKGEISAYGTTMPA